MKPFGIFTPFSLRHSLAFKIALLCASLSQAQWVKTQGPQGGDNESAGVVYSLAAGATGLFAGTNGNGIYRSTDNGDTWMEVKGGPSLTVHALIIDGDFIYAADDRGLYRSSNGGASWASVNNGLASVRVHTFAIRGATLFAGTDSGVTFTSDHGESWTVSKQMRGADVRSFAQNGSYIFAGSHGGVFRLAVNETTWTKVSEGFMDTDVGMVTALGSKIIAMAFSRVYVSVDNGSSRKESFDLLPPHANSPTVFSFLEHGKYLFAGTNAGVYLSTDNGDSWMTANTGLENTSANCLAINGATLFVGTQGFGVWKRPLSEMVQATGLFCGPRSEAGHEWSLREGVFPGRGIGFPQGNQALLGRKFGRFQGKDNSRE